MNPYIQILRKDKQYRMIEGLIAGLEANAYFDKKDMAAVLREYQEWVFVAIAKALDLAAQCEVDAHIKDSKYKDMMSWLRASDHWQEFLNEAKQIK